MKEGRVHIRLPNELKQQMQDYARRHHITLNALIEQHFRKLLEDEQSSDIEVGEQI